ncbi:MAG: hypothetical protein M1822_002014 [Bathelium mastoideum]|nr:MAG: hypothetical protein M1822_002014 [Bathelium mastoideum]
MPPKRMTANPTRPARYRPGKPAARETPSSEEEEEGESEGEDLEGVAKSAIPAKPAPPKATSFKTSTTNFADRERAAATELKKREATEVAKGVDEDEFVTDEEDEEETEDDESASEDESEEKESSSEDEAARRKMMRPVFIKKGQRNQSPSGGRGSLGTKGAADALGNDEDQKKKRKDALIQAQLDQRAAEQVIGRRQWDDDDIAAGLDDLDVDDTDDLDPAAEYAAWKLRELQRVKRAREKVERAEREREEIERRRNLTEAERKAEDREREEQVREERERERQSRITKNDEKGGYMQRYHHKGAFYMDSAEELGLTRRDLMGAKYEDDIKGKDALPQYLQIRDATKIGKKGRTRYKDMRTEDTGQWGDFAREDKRPRDRGDEVWAGDSRFKPDYGPDRRGERTGANAGPLGERKRAFERDDDGKGGKRPRVGQ